MKFSIVLVAIGALCLSSVEALKKTHKYEWQPPCEEDDVQCWDNLGENCDVEDDACIAQALGVPEEQFPDCQDGDSECWNDFWSDLFSTDEELHHHNKLGRGDGHAKNLIKNHKKLGRGDGHFAVRW